MIPKNLKFTLLWLVGIAIAIGLLSLVWLVPQYQANKARERVNAAINNLDPKDQPKERLQLEKDLTTAENGPRTTIAQVIGGLVLLLGLYFTYQNVKTAQHNLRVTEDGKLTDRFSKAVELLGNGKLDIQLGGIYALERLAKDSKNDHWTIMEVLTAYVREHSMREELKIPPEKKSDKVDVLPKISADIQAILDVIGRRNWRESESNNINLSGADLSGADLSGVNLSGVNLIEANLRAVNLSGTNLRRSNFSEANLRGADLFRTDLSEAYLFRTNLRGANLFEANLSNTTLNETEFGGANLIETNLSEADLNEANFRGANLKRAKNLTWEQISTAYINSETMLPPDLDKIRITRIKED